MNNKRVDFKIGDYVKVKKGVLEPENAKYRIGDWQGIIIGEYISMENEPLIAIKWEQYLLNNLQSSFEAAKYHDIRS
ncbi:hypothetical protein [Clostridium tagluense]|uniref:hypothetical protein n=1 Tax=Clostridium tagluense TaxID=360422 RepID=UPI001C6F0A3A|nr:hypothetical protein [Clostridium tagluense]MBW9158037.1 hypothetical protein [Clostridium tagluense]WLC66465.1 hypothetical protein KTC93_04410 [Clostridium tagluense]